MTSFRRTAFAKGLVALGVFALGVMVFMSLRSGWEGEPRSGRLDEIGAELLYLDASEIVERGPSRVMVLRFDGPVELRPRHYREAGLDRAQTVDRWREHLDAPVVFNAGQFDEQDEHLGWLKSDGEWLSKLYREQWKALLVSTPREGPAGSGILDLNESEPNIVDRYRNAVQSMMLFDETRELRVRESNRTACRTVVAQDDQGRILLVLTEGAVTLASLGRWLADSDLGISRAMNLDGGLESQVSVKAGDIDMSLYGQYGSGSEVFDAGVGGFRRPIPAVIAIRPVREPPSRASR